MSSAPFQDPNPYQSPAAASTASATSWATAIVIEHLTATRPWVLFISIVGFVVAGLMVFGGLLFGVFMVVSGGASPVEGAIAIFYPFFGLLYFFPSLYMLRYARRIRELSLSHQVADLEAALAAQKSFWRFCGIALAIILALYGVLLGLGAIAGIIAALAN
ncbi:MAG TPA: hypothetical protein VFI31_30510 [Pirellulales bacterium]|nr:hypothetical protein [Pirellulales bacterium]